ncbi:hypothetical protein ACJJTC_015980 [Scirpophaga incertulas]
MNSEGEPRENENEDKNHVVGDVIGDTAYSERFVLKTLLKLSDVNLIKDGINEQSLLNDLRTLWNMTAEKDVVLYLLKHDAFELFNFVLERCRFAEYISLGVRDIADKLQESRLRWFGHVKRRPPDYVGNVVSNLEIPGVRPRGRPKTRWTDVVRKDLQSCNVSEEDTSDRAKWRRKTRKADPTIRWE